VSRSKLARNDYGLDTGPTGHWRHDAACRDRNPEDWSLVAQSTRGPVRVSVANLAALAICRVCPVRVECHDAWADLPANERGGFVAGAAVWSPRGVEVSDYRQPKEARGE
jgi:hypothetical protein